MKEPIEIACEDLSVKIVRIEDPKCWGNWVRSALICRLQLEIVDDQINPFSVTFKVTGTPQQHFNLQCALHNIP